MASETGTWIKSSFCTSSSCVEVDYSQPGVVSVRSEQGDPRRSRLLYDPGEWNAFFQGVLSGEFPVPADVATTGEATTAVDEVEIITTPANPNTTAMGGGRFVPAEATNNGRPTMEFTSQAWSRFVRGLPAASMALSTMVDT